MDKRMEKILQECFHPIRGKANLHKIEPDIKQAKRHLGKALNNLRAMELMFSNDLFDWTVICGYYAMYHSVLASLLKIGLRATAHHCAIAAFEEFYVKRGKVNPEYTEYIEKAKQLEEKYANLLEEAKENRITVQYGIGLLTNNDAEWIIGDAKEFVLKIEEILAE